VRERFKSEFPTPSVGVTKELLAPPLSQNFSLVGTAFDYLLRFYIQRLNPKSITGDWIAEQAALCDIEFDDCSISLPQIVMEAKKSHLAYLRCGTIEEKLLRQTICLAQLDAICRRGLLFGSENSYFKSIGKVDLKDIQDLRRLMALVRPETFKSKKVSILNPAFGRASELVGGADCDLVIDDLLVEIKTSKYFQVERSHFDQLIGYYFLSKIGGIDGAPKGHEVKRLGIYFSRHGYLWTFQVGDVIKMEQLARFTTWFRSVAESQS